MTNVQADTTLTEQDSTGERQETSPEIDSEGLLDVSGTPGTTEGEPDTFPRSYVERLRQESAEARVRAQRTDELAQRLHGALVSATGRLADPTDLVFDEAHLEDDVALNAAIDDLLARKPHLGSRVPRGDVGQGVSDVSATVDLAGLLRSRA